MSLVSKYMMYLPGAVYSGLDSLTNVRDILAKGYKKAAVFTSKELIGAGLLDGVKAMLDESKTPYEILSDLPSEPSADEAQSVAEAFYATGADLIIAVGGGSVMDIAKLASVIKEGELKVRDLLKDPSRGKKWVHTLLIPTTAGTGSEATPNSIVTVPEEDLKVGIVNGEMLPDHVILDAAFIRNLPSSIAASTGLDAMCHAIECFTGNKANPFSDIFAKESLSLIFANLEKACEGGDMDAKQNMLLASFYAGIAIAASGTTAVHALSYPLGGKYHIPHGVSNAILLVPVMRFNADAILDRMAMVYDLAGGNGAGTDIEKSDWVINRLNDMVVKLNIPSDLGAFGVNIEHLDTLAESGMKVTRLLNNNVKKLTIDDARNIYSEILK